MRVGGWALGLAAMAMAACSAVGGQALAAPAWQPPTTIDYARGVPVPQVAVDGAGKTVIAYANATSELDDAPVSQIVVRAADGTLTYSYAYGPGFVDQQVAVSSAGATAIASVAVPSNALKIMLVPAPGFSLQRDRLSIGSQFDVDTGGMSVRGPRVAIDGAGRTTVVWTSPPSAFAFAAPARLYQVTATADGVGPVERLGDGERCSNATVQSNERGDTVVHARCDDTATDVFVRPAGGAFAPAGPTNLDRGAAGATIDGAGTVIAYGTIHGRETLGEGNPDPELVDYAVRPPGGAFGPPTRIVAVDGDDRQFAMRAQEDGRVVAAWLTSSGIGYAIKPSGGDFGPRRTIATSRSLPARDSLGLAVAPRGPAVLSWRAAKTARGDSPGQQVFAAIVGADGAAGPATGLSVPGRLPTPVDRPFAFSINEHGLAVGTWEQSCGPNRGFAVMSAVFDDRRGTAVAPCQDTAAPKVAVRPQRARLVGRRLRVRIGCDEACRIVVRARVLRGGKGRPLATAKTRRGTPIGARRYRTFALPLTARQAAKVRAALTARRRISVRLALSVRDRYENGAVRRVAVPLRR